MIKTGKDELVKSIENHFIFAIDPGAKIDKVTGSQITLNSDNTITRVSVTFSINTSSHKNYSTENTGERENRINSTKDGDFDKFCENFAGLNTERIFENLEKRQYAKSANQRANQGYVHQIFEHWRALRKKFPDGRYSNPPIVAFGTGANSKSRREYLSRFFTVVDINENKTSQTCVV